LPPTVLDGLDLAGEQAHDVIVMDRMLPGMDGLSVISRLREDGVSTPVLILSALGRGR
jgi:two-component system OmpR family response regulator